MTGTKICASICAALIGCALTVGLGAPSAVADPVAQITEFSAGLNPGSAPGGIAPAADANLWFTDPGSRAIGRINPSTGQITEFSAGLNAGGNPAGIAPGPDGNLWFTDEGCANGGGGTCAIGRIVPSTGQITEFSAGLPAFSDPGEITPGADGNLWFTDAGAIGRIVPSTGHITEFSSGLNKFSLPVGIASGADGNLWFTDGGCAFASLGGICAIGRIDPSTGQITEFSSGLNPNHFPDVIAAGADGNLWFTDRGCVNGGACAIGRIDPSTQQITEFSSGLNVGTLPNGIAPGADGNLWFADDGSTRAIGQIVPSTGQITEFSAGLNGASSPGEIVPGADGNLWFTDQGTKVVGRVGAGAPAAVVAPPVLSGAGRAGAPESCQAASFASWTGVGPSTSLFSFDGYRWVRDGAPIAGQSGQSYTASIGDVGHRLACSVTVTYPLPLLVTAVASSPAITVQPPVSTPVPAPAPAPVPPPPAPVPQPPSPVGVLGALKLSPRNFSLAGRKVGGRCVKPTSNNNRRPACTRKVKLTVHYTLSSASTVSFRIGGSLPGRKAAGRCVAQTRKNRHHNRCTRHITLRGTTTQHGNAGPNRLILVRKLAPGSYTLTATPAGGRPQHATFKVGS